MFTLYGPEAMLSFVLLKTALKRDCVSDNTYEMLLLTF